MTDSETKPVGDSSGGNQNESLQLQLTLQLMALVVMAATLAFFFYMQARRGKFDLQMIKPPATAMMQSFEQDKPNVDAFLAKLVEYGRAHPDFAPIMRKYQIPTNAPAATAVPATSAPKPATAAPTPATKK